MENSIKIPDHDHIDQIIAKLNKNFKVLDVIDLYAHELTSRLSAIRKDQFADHERILIVQSTEDEYVYADQPGKFLSRLQLQLQILDISNYFVLLLTGNMDIDQELLQVQKQFSLDNLPIRSYRIDKTYKKEIKKFQDTYCVLPWIHLFVGPNGDVLPCCIGDQNLPLGNVYKHDLTEIMTGPAVHKIKSNMINNVRSKACESCYRREDDGLPSLRIQSNQQFKQYTSSDINTYAPISLRIELNHLCNFKCRMCNEWFSSAIAQETKSIHGADAKLPYHYIGINTLDSDKRKKALAKILDILDTVEELSFGGGEPLLGQEHYDMLFRLIDLGRTDVKLHYHTNLSKLCFKDIRVVDLWKKFSSVTVSASIDASGSVAEYIRHGTVWKDIIENIDVIKHECATVDLKITSVVGFLNVQNLISMQQDWISTKYIAAEKFSTNCMITPSFLSVATLPINHKTRLQKAILDHIKWCKSNSATAVIQDWQNIVDYMMNNDLSYTLHEFRHRMKALDLYRNESLVSTFPEFADLY